MRVPVTPAQHALLFIQELVPRVDLYNIGWRIVFDNPIDVDAIRSSLDRLIQAQPTFRTQFDSSTGVPVAEVVPVTAAPLEIIRVDATGVDWADTVEREGQSLVRQPIPLDRAPLCRFRLLIAPDAAALLCSAHHIISDGVSLRVFLDELVAGYHGGPGTQVDVAERERWLHGELTAQCRAARTAIDDGTLDRLASTLHGVAPTVLAPSPERPERTRFRGH